MCPLVTEQKSVFENQINNLPAEIIALLIDVYKIAVLNKLTNYTEFRDDIIARAFYLAKYKSIDYNNLVGRIKATVIENAPQAMEAAVSTVTNVGGGIAADAIISTVGFGALTTLVHAFVPIMIPISLAGAAGYTVYKGYTAAKNIGKAIQEHSGPDLSDVEWSQAALDSFSERRVSEMRGFIVRSCKPQESVGLPGLAFEFSTFPSPSALIEDIRAHKQCSEKISKFTLFFGLVELPNYIHATYKLDRLRVALEPLLDSSAHMPHAACSSLYKRTECAMTLSSLLTELKESYYKHSLHSSLLVLKELCATFSPTMSEPAEKAETPFSENVFDSLPTDIFQSLPDTISAVQIPTGVSPTSLVTDPLISATADLFGKGARLATEKLLALGDVAQLEKERSEKLVIAMASDPNARNAICDEFLAPLGNQILSLFSLLAASFNFKPYFTKSYKVTDFVLPSDLEGLCHWANNRTDLSQSSSSSSSSAHSSSPTPSRFQNKMDLFSYYFLLQEAEKAGQLSKPLIQTLSNFRKILSHLCAVIEKYEQTVILAICRAEATILKYLLFLKEFSNEFPMRSELCRMRYMSPHAYEGNSLTHICYHVRRPHESRVVCTTTQPPQTVKFPSRLTKDPSVRNTLPIIPLQQITESSMENASSIFPDAFSQTFFQSLSDSGMNPQTPSQLHASSSLGCSADRVVMPATPKTPSLLSRVFSFASTSDSPHVPRCRVSPPPPRPSQRHRVSPPPPLETFAKQTVASPRGALSGSFFGRRSSPASSGGLQPSSSSSASPTCSSGRHSETPHGFRLPLGPILMNERIHVTDASVTQTRLLADQLSVNITTDSHQFIASFFILTIDDFIIPLSPEFCERLQIPYFPLLSPRAGTPFHLRCLVCGRFIQSVEHRSDCVDLPTDHKHFIRCGHCGTMQ